MCWEMVLKVDSQAKKPSSSSLLLGAGSGAPDPSVVGSCTYPSPNGFSDFILDSNPRCWLVFTGGSSRLDHPKLFIESRNDEDAISVCGSVSCATYAGLAGLLGRRSV